MHHRCVCVIGVFSGERSGREMWFVDVLEHMAGAVLCWVSESECVSVCLALFCLLCCVHVRFVIIIMFFVGTKQVSKTPS